MRRYFMVSVVALLCVLATLTTPIGAQHTVYPMHQDSAVAQVNVTFQSRGYALYGEISYPENSSSPLPAVVVCEGTAGYTSMYSWLARAIAADGYVTFLFDFPGQGKSEGLRPIHGVYFPWLNLYLRFGSFHESTIHYLNGDCVQATKDAISYLIWESPVASIIDGTRIGLIGHSLGGLVVTETASQDPRVKAVVALSHATPSSVQYITVPLQFLGGAFEIAPSSKSIPILLTSYRNAHAPKELVFIAGGTHLGFTTALGPLCPCPVWQKPCCLHYALGWFDWFLKGGPQAYSTIISGDANISSVLRSRYNFGDGDCFLRRC